MSFHKPEQCKFVLPNLDLYLQQDTMYTMHIMYSKTLQNLHDFYLTRTFSNKSHRQCHSKRTLTL